jgi:WD40 repeat protein
MAAALCLASVAPPAAASYEVFVQAGHASAITGVAASADGRWAVSVDAGGELKLWDAATRRELWRAAEVRGAPAPRFSADGAWLIATNRAQQLVAFDAASGAQVLAVALPAAPAPYTGALAVTGEAAGARAWVGLAHGAVVAVNLATRQVEANVVVHTAPVVALAAVPAGLLTAGRDRRVALHAFEGAGLAAAPRWSMTLPRAPRALALDHKHGRAIVAMEFGGDARKRHFLAADLWLIDLANGAKAGEEEGLLDANVQSLAVSPDGAWLAVGGGNPSASARRRADAINMVEMRPLALSGAPRSPASLRAYFSLSSDIRSVAFAGERLLIGSRDSVPRLWPYLLADGSEIEAPRVAPADVAPVPALPPQRIVAAAARDMRPGVAAVSPNGRIFALALSGARQMREGLLPLPVRIALVHSKTSRELASLEGHGGGVEALAWSTDGRWLASAAEDDIRLWNAVTGDEIKRIERSRGAGEARLRVSVLAFSPDRARIAIAYSDGLVTVYDTNTLEYLARTVLWMRPSALRFEGDVLVVQGANDDGHTRAVRFPLAASSVPLSGYATSPLRIAQFDARRLMVGDGTGALTEWQLDQGRRGIRQGAVPAAIRAADAANDFAFVAGLDTNTQTVVLRQRTPRGASRWLADSAGPGTAIDEEQPLAAPTIAAARTRLLTAWTHAALPTTASGGRQLTHGRLHLIDTESGRRLAAFGDGLGRITAMALSPNADIAYVMSLAPEEAYLPGLDLLGTRATRRAQISAWRLPAGTPLWKVPVEWVVQGSFPQMLATAEGVLTNMQTAVPPAPGGSAAPPAPADSVDAALPSSAGLCWGQRFAVADGGSAALCGAPAVRRMALAPDGQLLALATADRRVLLMRRDGSAVGELPLAAPANDLRFSANGKRLAVAAGREVQLFEVATRALLARLVDFYNGEWVLLTPEGYFASSARGSERLSLRHKGRSYALDQFFDVFYRPDLVQKKLAGESIAQAGLPSIEAVLAAPPPQVALEALPDDGSGKLRLRYRATTTGGGVGEVRVYQNGKLVLAEAGAAGGGGVAATPSGQTGSGAAAGDASGRQIAAAGRRVARAASGAAATPPRDAAEGIVTLDAAPGANRIEVVAFNGGNQVRSAAGVLDLAAREAAPARLVIAAFGVGRYASPRANLRFPAKDARDVARDLAAAARPLFGAANIPLPVVLTDQAATRRGILERLAAIGRDLKPQDVLVVFIASHGVMDDGEYAMVTHEFDGRLSDSNSIGAGEIVRLARDARALKQIWVLDTCHAGGIGRSLRGLMDAQVSVLARQAGVHMMAAASTAEQAKDGHKGNGLFTHAILKALKSGEVDFNRDGRASALEFGEFSRDEATVIARQVGWNQTPLLLRQGRDFDVYRVPR